MYLTVMSALLASCVVLTSCGETVSTETTDTTAVEATETTETIASAGATGSTQTTASSVATVTEGLAFSGADCMEFTDLEPGDTLDSILPSHAQDNGTIAPVAEYFEAVFTIHRSAKEQYDALIESLETGESQPLDKPDHSQADALLQIERVLQASTSPELIPASALLADRIEEDCGANDLTLIIWRIHDDALFMQAQPPAGYCEAYAEFGPDAFDAVEGFAPDAHREWLDAVLTFDVADESSRARTIGAPMRANMYRAAQCGENIAELLATAN